MGIMVLGVMGTTKLLTTIGSSVSVVCSERGNGSVAVVELARVPDRVSNTSWVRDCERSSFRGDRSRLVDSSSENIPESVTPELSAVEAESLKESLNDVYTCRVDSVGLFVTSLVSECLGVEGGRLPSESGREGEEVTEATRSSGAGRGGSRGA